MDGLTQAWNTLLVWPIEGALLGLTSLAGNAGLAIILFTIAVRTLMLPLGIQQVRSQRAMMKLQPQMAEIQRKYANDRQRAGQETMRLYKENGVNPVAGCLPLVLQMPIWIALYSALINLSSTDRAIAAANCEQVYDTATNTWRSVCDLSQALARLIEQPGPEHWIASFHAPFLWIPNLGAPPVLTFEDPSTWPLAILPLLTAATQWVVQRMTTMPAADPQQQQMARMMEIMPIMFLFFAFQVASGLVLYWVVSNLYSVVQQRFTTGWGTLPYLGKPAAAVPAADSSRASASAPAPRPRRRSGGASGRKRRGK